MTVSVERDLAGSPPMRLKRREGGPSFAASAAISAWWTMAEAPMGLFPQRLYVVTTLVSLVCVPLAAAAGAWQYKEM